MSTYRTDEQINLELDRRLDDEAPRDEEEWRRDPRHHYEGHLLSEEGHELRCGGYGWLVGDPDKVDCPECRRIMGEEGTLADHEEARRPCDVVHVLTVEGPSPNDHSVIAVCRTAAGARSRAVETLTDLHPLQEPMWQELEEERGWVVAREVEGAGWVQYVGVRPEHGPSGGEPLTLVITPVRLEP